MKSTNCKCSACRVGVEEKIIFLNGFRWEKSIMPSADMLLLLEGRLVHFPATKTHYCKDISWRKAHQFFCTSKGPIVISKASLISLSMENG